MGREEGGGFRMGTHVYLWQIHFDIWQNQYNIVKLNKIKFKKITKKKIKSCLNLKIRMKWFKLDSPADETDMIFTWVGTC